MKKKLHNWLQGILKNEKGNVILPVALIIAVFIIIGGILPVIGDMMLPLNITSSTNFLENRGYTVLAADEDLAVPTGRGATIVIAASDSTTLSKAQADTAVNATNDQTEINTALDSGVVSVLLLPGTYYVTGDINVGPGDTLFAAGASVIIKVPDGTDGTFNIVDITGANATIQGFKIDGNKANQTGGIQTAVNIQADSDYVKILNLWLTNIYGGDGVLAPVAPSVDNLLIDGCTLLNIDDDGLDINGVYYSTISNNYFKDIGDNGIDTEGAYYCTFTANTIDTCGGHGIEIEEEGVGYAQYNTIVGNNIKNCSVAGVELHAAKYNTISGNVLINNGVGIRLTATGAENSTYNVITGNYIQGGSRSITETAGEADFNLIANNYLATRMDEVTSLHTQVYDNFVTDYHLTEKKILRYKNNSGATMDAGNVVVVDSSSQPYYCDLTTTRGDGLVLGIVVDNTGIGDQVYIQVSGEFVDLTVNGVDDIAAGDLLATFTTAGIACKAQSGQMAFAIALEGYTADDSNGTINVLLITPRLAP